MSDVQHADAHAGHGPTLISYLVVGLALSVFTIVSFVVNGLVKSEKLAIHAGFAIILGVAIVKATLVGAYFMHLKFDWRMIYFMLIPVFILATMMMIVLLPDIVLAWK
jgi:cytochrome c oxidase subunit IV